MSLIINKLELYFVPLCFTLGLIGNLLGTITILSAAKLRKRTVYFILAIIGLADTSLLCSQMQRWLASHYDQQFYLINNSLCKCYLMLVRSSILISSTLVLSLTTSSVIRLYLGAVRLSTHSKLGQLLSKLCVLISISLSMSVSWHELWTSGLRNTTHSIHIIEEEELDTYETNTESSSSIDQLELICSKNVDSILIVEIINYVYFVICITINFFLILNSLFIYLKLKRENIFYNVTKVNSFLCTNFEQGNKMHKNYGTDNVTNLQTSSFTDLKEVQPSTSKHSVSNKPMIGVLKSSNPKKFTYYLIIISLLSSLFCLPFIFFDLIFYKDVIINQKQLNTTQLIANKTTNLADFEKIPLILINIPHVLKFYLLFLLNAKFRAQLGRFMRFRFYLNVKLIRNISWIRGSSTPASSTKSSVFSRFNLSDKVNKKRALSSYADDYDNISNVSNVGSNNEHLKTEPLKKKKIEFKFNFYPNCFFHSTSLNHSKK